MIKFFKKIEKEYAVEDIFFQDLQVWSFLRNSYFWKTIEDKTSSYTKEQKKTLFSRVFLKFSHAFYGFKNWFKRYDYIFFSDSQERVLIEDQYVDKTLEYLIQSHGYGDSLLIESPIPTHYNIKKVSTAHIVSNDLLSIIFGSLTRIIFFFKSKNFKLSTLEYINKEENLDINYQKIILQFLIRKELYKIFFKIYKPKMVYIKYYYGQQEIICAANELEIKTVEVQHGLIGKEHHAYNFFKKLDKIFFPNTFLCYGEYDKKNMISNAFIAFSHILPIGSYALELLKSKQIPSKLKILSKQYQKTVSISTQYTVEEELAFFIQKVAKKSPNVGFFFSLRHFDKKFYEHFDMPHNVYLFYKEYSCYEILQVSDIHCSVYSTCAIEATYFNKISILVNIQNLSEKFIDIKESSNIYLAEDENDFLEILVKKYIEEDNMFYLENFKNISLSNKEKR